MIFQTNHNEAKNGRTVNTTVELIFEENEPMRAKPWRVVAAVDYAPLFTSHHETLSGAKKKAGKVHNTYLTMHGGRVK